ncbi:MAG: mannose-6-phosphate isomerase, class I [Bacteroidetes bacterium]|nr:mannose-6-phosphate isomerase, class I [Bacteroidota bacterium]
MELNKNKVFKLTGKVQHYAWGGFSFIPGLLHIENSEQKHFAEYWMGAHDNASSEISTGNGYTKRLNEFISANKEQTLGKYVSERFGRLPYLFKILDVKDMLSIQVHPSKKSAEIEFAAEHKKGIPVNAPNRNYKDDNHKPELMLALGEFWLLHGFKSPENLKRILARIPELNFLLTVFGDGNYHELYRTVMEMDQEIVNETLQPLLDRIVPAYQKNELRKGDENFWAARAALTYNEPGKIDRGIFSVYIFNLLNLHSGEAIFQDAGLPHAYLEGQNVEIMANSDNVLRGGLTPKHIDVHELMKHVKFEETIPDVIHGKEVADHVEAFVTPAPDFELRGINLQKGEHAMICSGSAEIFIVMKGNVEVKETEENKFERKRGETFISFDKATLSIKASEDAVVYIATVPVP